MSRKSLEPSTKLGVKGIAAVVHHAQNAKATVILSHELHGSKDDERLVDLANHLSQRGYRVIRYDASHGSSKDTEIRNAATEMQSSLRKVINQAKKQYGGDIAVIGTSLGASVALLEASENPRIKTLVSIGAPLLPQMLNAKNNQAMRNGIAKKGFFTLEGTKTRKAVTFTDEFQKDIQKKNSLQAIKKLEIPVMYIHGMQDNEVQFDHSKQAHAATKGKKSLHPLPTASYSEEEAKENVKNLTETWLSESF